MARQESNAASLRGAMQGGRVLGTFLKLAATETVDIAAGSRLDFAIVDLEHSQLSEREGLGLVRHGLALGFPMVARVPACDPGQINRLLEAGAAGIQLSSVRSSSQVRSLVEATRYPPHGRRSVSLAHPAAGYGAIELAEAVAAPPPLLVGQIETATTEDRLEEIFAAGLEVAFAGVTDLLVGMDLDSARVDARVKEIETAAAASGVAFGTFAPHAASIPGGARYVALSSDVALLRAATAKAVSDAG